MGSSCQQRRRSLSHARGVVEATGERSIGDCLPPILVRLLRATFSLGRSVELSYAAIFSGGCMAPVMIATASDIE